MEFSCFFYDPVDVGNLISGSSAFSKFSLNIWKLSVHVHWVCDVIQPSHPLLPSSPFALNLSQHQSLFQWVGSSYQVAKVLALQHQSFPGWFPLGLTGLISWQFKVLSRVFSSTTVRKHQFFSDHHSLWSKSHICTWVLEKIIALTRWTFFNKVVSLLFNTLSRFAIAFLARSKCL